MPRKAFDIEILRRLKISLTPRKYEHAEGINRWVKRLHKFSSGYIEYHSYKKPTPHKYFKSEIKLQYPTRKEFKKSVTKMAKYFGVIYRETDDGYIGIGPSVYLNLFAKAVICIHDMVEFTVSHMSNRHRSRAKYLREKNRKGEASGRIQEDTRVYTSRIRKEFYDLINKKLDEILGELRECHPDIYSSIRKHKGNMIYYLTNQHGKVYVSLYRNTT